MKTLAGSSARTALAALCRLALLAAPLFLLASPGVAQGRIALLGGYSLDVIRQDQPSEPRPQARGSNDAPIIMILAALASDLSNYLGAPVFPLNHMELRPLVDAAGIPQSDSNANRLALVNAGYTHVMVANLVPAGDQKFLDVRLGQLTKERTEPLGAPVLVQVQGLSNPETVEARSQILQKLVAWLPKPKGTKFVYLGCVRPKYPSGMAHYVEFQQQAGAHITAKLRDIYRDSSTMKQLNYRAVEAKSTECDSQAGVSEEPVLVVRRKYDLYVPVWRVNGLVGVLRLSDGDPYLELLIEVASNRSLADVEKITHPNHKLASDQVNQAKEREQFIRWFVTRLPGWFEEEWKKFEGKQAAK